MPKMLLRGWWMLHTTVWPEEARSLRVATTCRNDNSSSSSSSHQTVNSCFFFFFFFFFLFLRQNETQELGRRYQPGFSLGTSDTTQEEGTSRGLVGVYPRGQAPRLPRPGGGGARQRGGAAREPRTDPPNRGGGHRGRAHREGCVVTRGADITAHHSTAGPGGGGRAGTGLPERGPPSEPQTPCQARMRSVAACLPARNSRLGGQLWASIARGRQEQQAGAGAHSDRQTLSATRHRPPHPHTARGSGNTGRVAHRAGHGQSTHGAARTSQHITAQRGTRARSRRRRQAARPPSPSARMASSPQIRTPQHTLPGPGYSAGTPAYTPQAAHLSTPLPGPAQRSGCRRMLPCRQYTCRVTAAAGWTLSASQPLSA